MSQDNIDISTVSTEELIEELFNRCDHGIMMLLQTGYTREDNNRYMRNWKGCSHTCAGLATDMATTIMLGFYDEQTPADDLPE